MNDIISSGSQGVKEVGKQDALLKQLRIAHFPPQKILV